ncbi:hypothetical protein BV25DRAFT_1890628 [Artomyces pyxidatus]|uniref:Uncharacterized protein n=1 Tax=Artomyces pyxidatus TaxID=48021 RepID=A0ACB8SQI4_9AGAM|nr:hypothetical protein BV25DRAFT_1890628 [Artomyces pyxidatus]
MAVHITLKSGDQVKVNDHVYCSPSWSVRDGTPYSVARIMEFLPPDGASRGNTPGNSTSAASLKGKGKENQNYTRVRLAWYYRPSDVSDRPVADSRLLLAAIYSEICDITQLRSKCFVVHRDKITDLAGWKKRPDRFYFNRLFDPYIKKEFEVIQSNDVRNLPPNIREVLTSRYEYVVAEKEIVPDLTDTLRHCDTCTTWCPPPESVRCDRCKSFFHMGCVQPPLIAKPTRGYGWTCGPCSRAHEQAVEGHEVRHTTPIAKPKSNAPPARGRGRPRKDRSLAEKEENLAIKHFKMWPFRYFGLYTVAEDTLDADDLIFPRTTTRVGPKYQATIPALNSERDPDTEERGGDSTIEILSVVNRMSEAEVAELESRKARLTSKQEIRSSVDWLTEVTKRLSDAWLAGREMSSINMSNPRRLEKWKRKAEETRYCDREWDEDEKAAFEDAILAQGAELRAVRDEVGTRDIYEVVRYYGHWKNEKLGEENKRRRLLGPSYKPEFNLVSQAPDLDSDEEGSIVRQPTKANSSCGACRSRESKVWWKAPKNLSSNVLCDNCGMSWRKYADLNHLRPVREESVVAKAKTVEKREGTPLASSAKRAKTMGTSQSSPPPGGSSAPQVRCLACHKNGPVGKVLKCLQCHTRVHSGACGVVSDSSNADGWTCDLCQNEKTAEASLNTDCVLCPRPRRKNKDQAYPAFDNYLRVCKPTEGQGWAHVACAVFIPEVTFSDAARLRIVEGISTIPSHRWATKCALCNHTGGAVVQCSDCPLEYHVSCAWGRGYKFGFEVQAIKNVRRDPSTTVTFKEAVGSMHAVVRCKEHDSSRRPFYDICETNELGETALQVYCRTYKQAQVAQSHALLRKARRLDQIIEEKDITLNGHTPKPAEPKCYHCKTAYSPFFHPVPVAPTLNSTRPEQKLLCHKCFFEQQPRLNGNGHSDPQAMISS